MKGVSLILFILILLVSCNEQSPFYDSYSPLMIKTQSKYSINPSTNTKDYKVFEKHYDKNGNLTFHIEYNEKYNVTSKSNYTYNESEKVVFVTEFNENGDTINSFKKIYKHNSKGQVYQIEKIDKNGDLQELRRLEYDEKGNIKIEIIEKENVKVNEMNYDYIYGNSGEVNSIYIKDYSNGEVLKKDSIIYSENQIDLISIDSKGNINGRVSIIYDDSGNIIEEVQKSIDNKVKQKFIYSYTYY